MSGNTRVEEGPGDTDRRVRRTHRAVLDAFGELVLGRRYDEIRIGDILKNADVGRSTFYEHYRDKDDLLIKSMSGLLDVLASVADKDCNEGALEHVLAHFWENRQVAGRMLTGSSAGPLYAQLSRALAERIKARLDVRFRGRAGTPVFPINLIAAQVAEAEWAVIKTWLAEKADCTPKSLAAGLRGSTVASIDALWQ